MEKEARTVPKNEEKTLEERFEAECRRLARVWQETLDPRINILPFVRTEIKAALEATRLEEEKCESCSIDYSTCGDYAYNAAVAEQNRKIEEYLKSLEV